MSETDVELSAQARALLSRHASTGEPSGDDLARLRARVLAAPVPAVEPARRSWFRHELMAVAAVVVVLLVGQGLYLAWRAHTDDGSTAVTDEMKAVGAAYRAGDFAQAQRLASQHCSAAACRPLAASLDKALSLASRLDALSPAELDELRALDGELAQGEGSVIGERLARRSRPPPSSPEALRSAQQLFDEGNAERKKRNYEAAVIRFERCVHLAPDFAPCYRALGSAYAAMGSRDQSSADIEKARASYERFVQIAPPDDEFVPKVQAILDAAKDSKQRTPAPPPSTDESVRDIYLRAYQLEETAPAEAAALFNDVVERTPGDDEYHQKAAERLRRLSQEPDDGSTIVVERGRTRDLPLEVDAVRVAVGDDAIADIVVANSRLLRVKGLARGKTTLLVWLVTGQRRSFLLDVR